MKTKRAVRRLESLGLKTHKVKTPKLRKAVLAHDSNLSVMQENGPIVPKKTMPLPPYSNNGPADCTIKPDTTTLKGKSVVITGGESPTHCGLRSSTYGRHTNRCKWIRRGLRPSIPRCWVRCSAPRALHPRTHLGEYRSFVTFGDIDEKKGNSLVSELGS